jgi:hypothetical protein
MEQSGVAVVVGNGLSIAVNPDLQLERLTASFLAAHAEERQLIDELVAGVDMGPVVASRDFEGIVAGLQSAEEVITAFMRLAEHFAHPDVQAAARVLNEHRVPELIRRLYYAYCAEVLSAIGEASKTTIPDEVLDFARWLRSQHQQRGEVSIFTLNYDLLMERMLLEEMLDLRRHCTDFFSGLEDRQHLIELYPGCYRLKGRLFYPQDPPTDRTIHLHHLHGCLTHFQNAAGDVYKVPSQNLRALDVYGAMARGNVGEFSPSIILGSRKAERARDWPFRHAFDALESAVRVAHTVCIAGYSFRDAAVNERLRSALGAARRIIVCDYAPDHFASEAFSARATSALGISADKVEWYLGGFAAGPPRDVLRHAA